MHSMSVIPPFHQPFVVAPAPVRAALRQPPLQDGGLSLDLPQQQYQPQKMVAVPFDPKLSNDGRFETLTEAMTFIGKHCMFHHHQFNRNLARTYLSRCRVLDLARGGFVTPAHLTKRDFDAAFHQASRVVSN